MLQIVIDTNVWVHVKDDLDCNKFICDLAFSENSVVLDYEGIIWGEYSDEIPDIYTNMYYKRISEQNRLVWISNKLGEKHRKKLIELGFHEDEDLAFVGAAMNTDKIIIECSNGDRDYGICPRENCRSDKEYQSKVRVAQYMNKVMNLNVKTPCQFREEYSDINN